MLIHGGISSTHHDAYDEIPHASEFSYNLGDPVGDIIAQFTAQTRAFTRGWVALNTGSKDCDREGTVRSGGCGKPPGALELHAAGALGCGVPP